LPLLFDANVLLSVRYEGKKLFLNYSGKIEYIKNTGRMSKLKFNLYRGTMDIQVKIVHGAG